MSLYKEIALRLEEDITQRGEKALSDVQTLGRRYGVSRNTMLQAVRLLREKGLLHFRRGQGISIVKTENDENVPPKESPKTTASERFYRYLLEKITEATYKKNEVLPKIQFFTLGNHVSNRTVITVLHRLVREGVIRKQGKQWLVGGIDTVVNTAHQSIEQRPTILLLQLRPTSWIELQNTPFQQFAISFNNQADASGVRLIPVLTEDTTQSRLFASGREEIRRLINNLGPKYLGTLVVSLKPEMPDMGEWLHWLAAFNGTVGWIGCGHYVRSTDSIKHIFRCCYGDWGSVEKRGAVALALDALMRAGHRTVGLAGFTEVPEKIFQPTPRWQVFERYAVECDVPPRLPRTLPLLFWNRTDGETNEDIVQRLRSRGVPHVRDIITRAMRNLQRTTSIFESLSQLHRDIIEDTAVIAPLLRDPECTALVAHNDFIGRRYYLCLKAAGIRVPQDVSLISFDNSFILKPFPVTTIDFGMTALGYKAFHQFYKDIPIRLSKRNQLWGLSSVIDNGSVASPRKKPLKIDLAGEIF